MAVVDFSIKQSRQYRVASIKGKVPWSEATLKAGFRELAKWTKARGIPTGKWLILSRGRVTWEACLEIKRPARGEGKIHVTVLPATMVAAITFDPRQVSPRVIYHGMLDFLKWRRKAKEIRSVGYTREVYDGDPWSSSEAWSRATVEYIVRK